MYEWMSRMFANEIRPNHFVSRISAELLSSQNANIILYPLAQKPDLPYDFEAELDDLLTSHQVANVSIDGERVSVTLSPKQVKNTDTTETSA